MENYHHSCISCRFLGLFDVIDSIIGDTSDLGSSFWGMILILASTNLLTARIAAGCFIAALLIVLFVAKNVSDVQCSMQFILPVTR